MDEKLQAEIYMAYLNKVLAGVETVGDVGDPEIRKLISLARTLLANDLSINSTLRATLKEKLLTQLTQMPKGPKNISQNEELGEEDLDHVAAGFTFFNEGSGEVCPRCGARIIIPGSRCMDCDSGKHCSKYS